MTYCEETCTCALLYHDTDTRFPSSMSVVYAADLCFLTVVAFRIYGFYDECKRRYNIKLWKTFTDCFNCLPVGTCLLCECTDTKQWTWFLVHGQLTIIFVVSVCLSVCLCRVFLSHLWSDFDQTMTYVICLGLVVSPRIEAVRPLGAGWPLKNLYFRGFRAQKTISSYSFDRIVLIRLIFGYIVERTNTKILSSYFLQFPSWTQIMTSSMTSFPVLQKLS